MTALCDAVAAGALASDPVGVMHRHRHQKGSPEPEDASTGMELLGTLARFLQSSSPSAGNCKTVSLTSLITPDG